MSAELPIGTRFGEATPARLNASRLNRHTFWCGQSGSGKTYALGVLLEQVLLHTRLPMVILDPNSDFVHLRQSADDAPPAAAAELADRDIRVLRRTPDGYRGELPLRVRFVDMELPSRAAVIQLDPVDDAAEFNAALRAEAVLRQAVDNLTGGSDGDELMTMRRSLLPRLQASGVPEFVQLAMRLENLGVADWDLWAFTDVAAPAIVAERPDATVIDLGGFDTAAEPRAAALAVLDELWARRHERIGRLIVIDEAHNLCPPAPATPVERLLTERIVQIAAEGRKYGLWLLMSTQRPSKVHPNALSQCDNLGLMKMSSPRDLDELAGIFGYAPEELLRQASDFVQGQVLFAGGFIDRPELVQMGRRLTREGGSDVAVPLR
ncbi:hypothetical protein GOHSU_04_01670 [Gordonia hirsuta DSM 44140 = NBRC 16056]|uniref:Helicase HerA central domain-containing protein n=1 Tax=Gordonia hirsuta DSM 44140 = NBRC 16056 TaxID=1121927 RepID=L7L8B2_9ACTN|nr:ATP-binding protein [Gordonia hirsuta]GAC56297.1 hypothetical protein GOHSU_04_01670 [Gordonia hirsuta DSM 44140 = NBRC 16056]